MNWWPFENTKRRRPRQNTRFRHRTGERDSKLAVKVQRSRREIRQVHEQRFRKLLTWSVTGALLLGAVFWVHAQWLRVFHLNPEFAVGDFEFKTNGGLTWKQAAATAGLRKDMNLMEADLAAIREKLLNLPRVKAVSIERRLPGRLAIEIGERLPVAGLTSRANSLGREKRIFLDGTGVAFKCEEYLRQYAALPVIDDSSMSFVNFGQEVESPATVAALELLEKFHSRGMTSAFTVSTIYAPNEWTLNVEAASGTVYTFNTQRLDSQLDRLAFILGKTTERGIALSSVNLQMKRNVPVVYDNRTTAAAPVSEPAKAVPLRPAPARTQRVSAPAAAPVRTVPASPREKKDIKLITRGGT